MGNGLDSKQRNFFPVVLKESTGGFLERLAVLA